jgi:hypothetical protein
MTKEQLAEFNRDGYHSFLIALPHNSEVELVKVYLVDAYAQDLIDAASSIEKALQKRPRSELVKSPRLKRKKQ